MKLIYEGVFIVSRNKLMTRVHSIKVNSSGFGEEEEEEEALRNNMFPLCLINASVTDAGGIRFRLVSFPLTVFLFATLPLQWSF